MTTHTDNTLKRALSMTPCTRGWIVTLECSHTRPLDSQPLGLVRCWTCDAVLFTSAVQRGAA